MGQPIPASQFSQLAGYFPCTHSVGVSGVDPKVDTKVVRGLAVTQVAEKWPDLLKHSPKELSLWDPPGPPGAVP